MKTIKHALLTFYLLIFTTEIAYAYLDPRVGSMILQLVLGGAAGIAIVARIFWKRIKTFFRPEKQDDSNLHK